MLDRLCERLIAGEALRTICDSQEMPRESEVYIAMAKGEEIRSAIARAREAQQDAIIDETIALADSATPEDVNVIKLRIWARQWRAAKLAPRKYGEKMAITGSDGGDIGIRISEMTPQQRKRRILELGKKEAEQNGDLATAKALGETLARMDAHGTDG